MIAAYPVLAVRGFLQHYRVFVIAASAAAQELHTDELAAQKLLCAIASLGLIEPAANWRCGVENASS